MAEQPTRESFGTFNALKSQLLDTLTNIEGVEIKPSPVAGGTALFCFGQEFARFYADNELCLRLTKEVSRCISCLAARLQAFGPDCRLFT